MNLYDQQRLVSAVFDAAAMGVKNALKMLKPSTSASAAPRFPPAFSHLTGSTMAKPAAARATTATQPAKPQPAAAKSAAPRLPKHSFAHLVAITAPAAESLAAAASPALPQPARPTPTRPSAPSAAALAAANTTLALRRGALAGHTPKPTAQALEAAAAVVARQHAADAAAGTEKHRAAAVVAAKILASGNHRGVRQP